MDKSPSSFGSELRVSPRSVIVALAILTLAVQPLSEGVLDPPLRAQARSYTLLLLALLAVAWLLDRWKPCVAK